MSAPSGNLPQSKSNKRQKPWAALPAIIWALSLVLLAPGMAHADFDITAATVNGGSTVTVAAGESVSLAATLDYFGNTNGANGQWKSTLWTINSISTCNNHVNNSYPGPDNATFIITAPDTAGTFALTLKPFSNDTCGGKSGSDFILASAITVQPPAVVLDHIRLEHDGDGLTCMPETIAIKACADSNCTSLYTAGSTTVTLSGTGWSSNPASFTGSTTVNLSKTTPQTVTLGTTSVSPSPTGATRCYVGVTQDCSLIFSGAGFIFAATTGGSEATIPTQTAGTTSADYYLRAVKTSTTTGACEAALTTATSVEMAYECNDPATCYNADLMSVNGGGASTPIARNNNGSVASYTSVSMTFDAGGNAQFTFNYGDVGMITLHAKKTLTTTLTGSSNAFVVKPSGFVLSGIQQTAAPNLANPGAADADGNKFIKAGEAFSATVTARAGSGTAYSFGRESTPEEITLSHTLVTPSGGAAGTLGNATIAGGSFSNGVATVNNLSWSEVGIITLTPTNSNYLGTGSVTGTTSGNIGRFIPAFFDTEMSAACGTFSYSDQPFPSRITARNTSGTTTTNYQSSFAKNVTLSDANGVAGNFDPASILASEFATGVADFTSSPYKLKFTFTNKLTAPATIKLRAVDTDAVSSASGTETTALIRSGRLVLQNAYGSEKEIHKMRLLTQYYNGTSFINNVDDTCTVYDAASLACSDPILAPNDTLICTDVTASGANIGHGQYFSLSAPNKTGALLYTLPVDPWLKYEWDGLLPFDYDEDPSARANFGIYRGNDRIINWREIVR